MVINSLGGGHTQTRITTFSRKRFQETKCAPTFGRRAPGLRQIIVPLVITQPPLQLEVRSLQVTYLEVSKASVAAASTIQELMF